jgi:tRNA(His) guanylyltransferase
MGRLDVAEKHHETSNNMTKQSMDKDELGDRMKEYEGVKAQTRFMPLLPIVARLDGRSFSKFTRGMERPFDSRFLHCMIETTKFLVDHTNANIGYTQSDEITLVWHQTDRQSEIWFAGREQKMVSQLAAQATLKFNQLLPTFLSDFVKRNPTFDARVWQVPNRTEGANAVLWREWDATKNAISMAASHYFSPKELHGLNGKERVAKLLEKDIVFGDYPASFKRGTFVQRRSLKKPFTPIEIASLPPKHAARTNPNLIIERSDIRVLDMPSFKSVTNREEVIFEGADPSNLHRTCKRKND